METIKTIGAVSERQVKKAQNTFDFADRIISIEKIDADKFAVGKIVAHKRLKVTYSVNNKIMISTISAQIGGIKSIYK